MKKLLSVNMILVLLALCGCTSPQENISETRFLFDTVIKLTADCSEETMDGAFGLCEKYDSLFSRTNKKSEVSTLNNSNGFVKVSDDTAELLKKAVCYCELSGGEYDITICPVSSLWDFEGTEIPDRQEIAEALKNVDYQAIEIKGNTVCLNGKQIDLGSIAKGFIAEKLVEYFKEAGVKSGIINLGGNVRVFGSKEYTVGIKKPYTADENIANIKIKNMSVVTSGVYERYIELDGTKYHHILDTETGFPKETDLLSATIIGKNSADCDALSTICILYGKEKAKKLIEETDGYEAIFVTQKGTLLYTSGLTKQNGVFSLNQSI